MAVEVTQNLSGQRRYWPDNTCGPAVHSSFAGSHVGGANGPISSGARTTARLLLYERTLDQYRCAN